MSRSLFQSVSIMESLVARASDVLAELKEIKALLQQQNEQGLDTRLLTQEETAEKLRVTLQTLYNWKQAGVLLPILIGSRSYYRLSDIIKSGIKANEDEGQTDQH
ncbi:hypothetical protein B0I27_101244 [Arcticibacter pallidicorallinus]|uniref:Helix-turn-helix protein n=2 Tax=Arcticibacter pallidicorallinus TaxID=1259464 RepID=A0A2T0UBF7_9SPHI|nr:hypothetical protein B0I27_101244 [Arcticibacter pallidicorallinus]